MEEKLVSGGSALEAKEREATQKYREYQNKLKKQRKKQQELEEERKRKEDELINVQKQYQNLEDEVEDNRKVIKLLKQKY
jgi:predicted nuclease with TOPRIM domain